MSAAKVMNVIARLPNCDGQVADAASACTWVQLEDAPRLHKIPKSECPDVWIRLPRLECWRSRGTSWTKLVWSSVVWIVLGKTIRRSFSEPGWEKVPNWECMFVHRKNEDYCCQWMWVTEKMAGKRQKYGSHVEDIDGKRLILENRHHFLTMYTWHAFVVNANQVKRLLNNIRRCLNHVFLLEQLTITGLGKASRENCSVVLRHGRTCSKNLLSDTVNWQTRKWSNFTRFEVSVWMIINSSRRNSNQMEKCQKFAHKISWNACIWHELDDLTYCGRSTNLQDQSQNGLGHVTGDEQDWFLIIITQTISDSTVMWETRHSIVEWVCSKTQILRATMRTRNQLQEESRVSLEAEHLFQ